MQRDGRTFFNMSVKKGLILAEETVKMILSAIVLVALIALIVSIYFSSAKNAELEKAKDSLDHIIEMIESDETQIEIFGPSNWYIQSWPSIYGPSDDFPELCIDNGWDSCVCIFKGKDWACVKNELKLRIKSNLRGKIFIGADLPIILTVTQDSKTGNKILETNKDWSIAG